MNNWYGISFTVVVVTQCLFTLHNKSERINILSTVVILNDKVCLNVATRNILYGEYAHGFRRRTYYYVAASCLIIQIMFFFQTGSKVNVWVIDKNKQTKKRRFVRSTDRRFSKYPWRN